MIQTFKRKAYFKVKEILEENRIPIIIGFRRVGKTTILRQLQEENKDSAYIRFDSLAIKSKTDLQVYEYIEGLIKEGIKMFLLDEIQEMKEWDLIIKNLYDDYIAFNSNPIKVVVTGSSSLSFLSRDTGVDRTQKVLMSTLEFDEFLQLSNKENTTEEFENFLGTGGFPGMINSNASIDKQMQLNLEPIMNDDIPAHYNIESSRLITLLYELSLLSNGEFNRSASSKNTQISEKQIDNYLEILERCQIIKKVYQVNEKGMMHKYPKFKVYINPHFHLWLLNKSFSQLDPKYKGHIIESYWLFIDSSINGYYKRYYYLKHSITNKEIDFVTLSYSGEHKFDNLIEFKYTDNVSWSDYSFMESIKANKKILWTKNKLKLPIIDVKGIREDTIK